MFGFKATYEELLKRCLEADKTKCAEKIVELLGGPIQ